MQTVVPNLVYPMDGCKASLARRRGALDAGRAVELAAAHGGGRCKLDPGYQTLIVKKTNSAFQLLSLY